MAVRHTVWRRGPAARAEVSREGGHELVSRVASGKVDTAAGEHFGGTSDEKARAWHCGAAPGVQLAYGPEIGCNPEPQRELCSGRDAGGHPRGHHPRGS